MTALVRQVFDEFCRGLKINTAFVKQLSTYRLKFTMKNQDHIDFFGGNLLGVHVVRFTEDDRRHWFDDILQVDEDEVTDRLSMLNAVNLDHNVASDTMNLSCVWLAHAIHGSHALTETQRHQAMKDVLLVLQYKFFTSRLFRHFKYPADKAIAEAAYLALSNKYDIKRYGSWNAMFDARTEDLLSHDSIHRQTIDKMDNDAKVEYMLNDTQGRLREMLKNLFDHFLTTHAAGSKVQVVSSMGVEFDGGEVLKDQSKSLAVYGHYIRSVIVDKNSFVRNELISVIEKIVHTMPQHRLETTLSWMSVNYGLQGMDIVEKVIDDTLIHSFDYFDSERSFVRQGPDLPKLLTRLYGVYRSSRSTEEVLMRIRDNAEEIVKKATNIHTPSVLASIRTGVMLYLVARSFSMHYYANR